MNWIDRHIMRMGERFRRFFKKPTYVPPRRIGTITKMEMTEAGLYVEGKYDERSS